MNIQTISKDYNISSRTLRYYEQIGLITSVREKHSREYTKPEIEKIKIILLLRKLKFSLTEIKNLFNNMDQSNLQAIIKNRKEICLQEIKKYWNEFSILKRLDFLINKEKPIDCKDFLLESVYNEYIENQEFINKSQQQRLKVVEMFFDNIKTNTLEQVKNYFHPNMDLEYITKVLNNEFNFIENEFRYHHIPLHSIHYNSIVTKVFLEKCDAIFRFVFTDDNKIAGLWNDHIYQK